jgi:Mrp family chromosome partitioning ATPase
MIGPTIVGSIVRFRRIVIFATVVAFILGFFWVLIAPAKYAGKAGIVITPLPATLSPGTATTHVTPATYNAQQVTLLQSAGVAQGAATIVNGLFPAAHLTGPEVQAATVVKPPVPGTTTSNGSTTQVIVTLGSPTYAAATANSVIKSYLAHSKVTIHQQASNSVAALNVAINQTKAQINSLAAPTRTSTNTAPATTTPTTPAGTGTAHPPATTTTRPPRTTTTRAPRTTTTRPPRTTTTTAPATTTTAAALVGPRSEVSIQLASYQPGNAANVTLVDTATTTTTAPATGTSGSSSTSSSSNANIISQRAALQTTLANLNRSKAQVQVNEAVDLAFQPTTVRATIPTSAVNGNYFRTLLIFSAAGLLIGILIAFVLASSRRRFENAADPEALYGVAMITTVPAFELPAWSRVALPVLTDPTDEPAEAYRILATVLRARRSDSDCLVVAFSAADLGAGTTTTVANCGLALAEMGERVLVIDGDPLGRGLTQALVDQQPTGGLGLAPLGLSELLEGFTLAETAIPAVGNPDLMIVPAGRSTDMAVRRWRTATMRSALEDMSERFDVVLIDTPPMGTASFSMDLSSIAEHLVLVIPHFDFVDLHESIARRLPIIGIELLGYVYNGALSNIRFAPYFPVLRGPSNLALEQGAEGPPAPDLSAPVTGVVAPVPAAPSPTSPPPARPSPPAPVYPDDTGVVPQVGPGHGDDGQAYSETGQVPAVTDATDAEGDTVSVPRVTRNS